MFGEASRFVIAKGKAPAFHIIFKYARQSLASNFDIAKDAMPNTPHQLRYDEQRIMYEMYRIRYLSTHNQIKFDAQLYEIQPLLGKSTISNPFLEPLLHGILSFAQT